MEGERRSLATRLQRTTTANAEPIGDFMKICGEMSTLKRLCSSHNELLCTAKHRTIGSEPGSVQSIDDCFCFVLYSAVMIWMYSFCLVNPMLYSFEIFASLVCAMAM